MHRFLPNLLFILIIFILATAFPLSTDILSLDLSQKIVENPQDVIIQDATYKLVPAELTSDLIDNSIQFEVESSTEIFTDDFTADFSISVAGNKGYTKTFKLADLNPQVSSIAQGISIIEVLKSELLNNDIEDYYTITVIHDATDEKIDFIASTLKYDKKLLETSNSLGSNQINLPLYFPTSDYMHLIPISRHIQTPDNRFRTLYNALVNGPVKGLGLYEELPVIPYAPNIRISNQVASIYLYSANMLDFESKFPVVTEAISRSFMSLDFLSGVKFLVDDSSQKTISGVDLSQTFIPLATNQAYVGYSNNSEHMMFLPYTIDSTLDVSMRIDKIWDILKFKDASTLMTTEMIQPIPSNIEMLSYEIVGDLLQIDLSSNFNTVLKEFPDYYRLMVNSILYAYTSLPEITQVQITTDGQIPVTQDNALFDFSLPLKPDIFINMEP